VQTCRWIILSDLPRTPAATNLSALDRRSVVVSFAKKGLTATASHQEARITLGAEAMGFSYVTVSLREAGFALSLRFAALSKVDPQHDDFDRSLLLVFAEHALGSVDQFA
jgi:hypothetical protein